MLAFIFTEVRRHRKCILFILTYRRYPCLLLLQVTQILAHISSATGNPKITLHCVHAGLYTSAIMYRAAPLSASSDRRL